MKDHFKALHLVPSNALLFTKSPKLWVITVLRCSNLLQSNPLSRGACRFARPQCRRAVLKHDIAAQGGLVGRV